MNSIRSWISAIRPRTLFLAVGTTICAGALAFYTERFNPLIFVLTTLLAIIMQLLSNMANDMGDFEHGTDTTGKRVGPQRALQSGSITLPQMKRAIVIAISGAIVIGIALIYEALKFMPPIYIGVFLLLGLASIIAAVKYTAGRNPYGYKGWGDIFSFIFFGPVPVVGAYFLHTRSLDFMPWLPAIGLGFLSVAVLNINNMRDMENDKESGKMTIACRLGFDGAKIYHSILTISSLLCFAIFGFIYLNHWQQLLYLPVFILLFLILAKIISTKEHKALDPYLKFTALSTCLLSISFAICVNL